MEKHSTFLLLLIIIPITVPCLYTLAQPGNKQQAFIAKEREPAIGMSSEDRRISTLLLNQLLADEFVLLAKTLNYHWNLVGPEFHDYHVLFNDQYHLIFELTDQIAERARAVGGIALGTLTDFVKQSKLEEDSGDIPTPREMVANLLHDHESIIKTLRAGINITGENSRDMGTSNFLSALIEKHEKIAWMLRSLLERRA